MHKAHKLLESVARYEKIQDLDAADPTFALDSEALASVADILSVRWQDIFCTCDLLRTMLTVHRLGSNSLDDARLFLDVAVALDKHCVATVRQWQYIVSRPSAAVKVEAVTVLVRLQLMLLCNRHANQIAFGRPVKELFGLCFPGTSSILNSSSAVEFTSVQSLIESPTPPIPETMEPFAAEVYQAIRMWHVELVFDPLHPYMPEPHIGLKPKPPVAMSTQYTYVLPPFRPEASTNATPRAAKRKMSSYQRKSNITYTMSQDDAPAASDSEFESDDGYTEARRSHSKRARSNGIVSGPTQTTLRADYHGRDFLPNCHWVSVEDYNRCRDLLYNITKRGDAMLNRSTILDAAPFVTSFNIKTAPSVVQQAFVAEKFVYNQVGKGYFINRDRVLSFFACEGRSPSRLRDFPKDFPPLTNALQQRQDKQGVIAVQDWDVFKAELAVKPLPACETMTDPAEDPSITDEGQKAEVKAKEEGDVDMAAPTPPPPAASPAATHSTVQEAVIPPSKATLVIMPRRIGQSK